MRMIMVNGWIATDATSQVSRNGMKFLTFTLANKEYGDPKNEDGTTKAQWFRVTSFNPRHVNLAQHLKKGRPITVVGNYSNRIYTSPKTGNLGIDNDVVANDIFFELGGERRMNANMQSAAPAQAQQVNVAAQVAQAVSAIPQVTATAPMQTPPLPTAATAIEPSGDVDLPF